MFLFLSKFLPLLIYPLGLSILLLILGLLFSDDKRWLRGMTIVALLLLLIGSNRWVSVYLARSLEWQYLPASEIPQAEVLVVLGGATEPQQYPRPTVEVNSAGDRVTYAAQLYHDGKAPVLLLSGGNVTLIEGKATTQADEMANLLEKMGVPKERMLIQPLSQNTHDDAEYCAQILKEKGISRVLLVTSAIHMPRSVALFRHLGVDVIPAPTDFTVTQDGLDSLNSFQPDSFLINILPNTSSLSLTTNALKEYLGLLVYRLQGWL